MNLNGGLFSEIPSINDVLPFTDEKLFVFNICNDIFILLIPNKFNGYNAVNVYNDVSAVIYDVFKLKPYILPI